MFDNNNNKKDNDKEIQVRENTLDEGINTFGEWLFSKDNSITWDNRLVLKQFVTGSHVVLQDNSSEIGIDVVVDIKDGIPNCRNCSSNDCAHVGFTICVMQMNNGNEIIDF